ncbi:MAG TPA: hypothetical protein VK483_05680 [Chitinophagaceae bacterium]|nr:hypothetical protein [Chitinophagaceae bacterium]
MENNFNNRDFEQFVKQNADQYRMFPSEKVWKNVHHALHTRRRWYGLGLTVLLLTAGIVTWVMLSPSVRNNGPISYNSTAVSQNKPTEQKITKTPILIAANKPADNKTHFVTTADKLNENLFITGNDNDVTDYNNESEKNTVTPVLTNINEPVIISSASVQIELPAKPVIAYNKQAIHEKPVSNETLTKAENSSPVSSENRIAEEKEADKLPANEKKDVYPLSIESVVNSYQHQRNGKKLSWEVFISPTISYRKLSENKAFINSAPANNNANNYYTSVADINSLVTHKPDIGIQLGFNAGYPLSKSLKILAGLQFNVSKYDIRVSYSTGDVATIALNTGGGANSVSTISNYRNNTNGSKADWLRNFYFSASVPVGVELKLSGNSKTQLGVIATVQPTFLLSDRAYLLTTDYKNYAQVPSLSRKWNMSTGFEIYAGVSTGNINWRIGPQVRYQLKSSYVAKYPFKEHLFDFGLKLGVMLNK